MHMGINNKLILISLGSGHEIAITIPDAVKVYIGKIEDS